MVEYVCPMHPEVRSFIFKKCPKCGMDLVISSTNSWKLAFLATAHCLTGCAIGEVLGMVIGSYFNIYDLAAIALSVFLAFIFGYLLTLIPLVNAGVKARKALSLAFASDTISITVMEVMDNLVIIFIPGALAAQVSDRLFWLSLIFSLIVAFFFTVPVNRYLISKGKGHAAKHV
jgi:hypothetical protein